ncbi:MAG: 1-phosphofructokinase [Clostridiales bacterium]|nr:1-phosphofructokinase [Clostridiales bacterium]
MIYTVTLNPALDKTVEIPGMTIDAVNRITTLRVDPGGKGINVSKVVKKLGSSSAATGILGGGTGRLIEAALDDLGIKYDFIYAEGETRTNLKVVDPVNHTNTDINEPGMLIPEDLPQKLLDKVLGKVNEGDIVILSGSIPRGCPTDIYRTWVTACNSKRVKTILDADGEQMQLGLTASPYMIKPNDHELSALIGRELNTKEELRQTALAMMDRYHITKMVISMGSSGALYVTADETVYAEGLKVPVGSTVGAGDSVVAAMAVAEEADMSLEEAARLSTATGAANVMCSGTQAAEYSTIQELMPRVVIHKLL